MADMQRQTIVDLQPHHVSGKTVVLTSLAGIIIGGPLIGLMAISFAATTTLLLVTSPLFLIFSPVLFGAVCVFGLAMLGFAMAAAMAIAALSSVAWVLRSFPDRRAGQVYGGGVSGKTIESDGGGADLDWYSRSRIVPAERTY